MRRGQPRATVRAGALVALGLLAVEAHAAQWVEVRSPHFRVFSDAPRRAQRVAGEFEEVRRAIDLFFPGIEHDPSVVPIFAFSSSARMREFTGYGGRNTAGFFRPGELGGEIVLSLEVDSQQAWGVLYHEYFHSVTRHSLPGLPLWLNEGLAEIWANSSISGRKIQVGLVARGHMRYLGQAKLMPLDEMVDPNEASRSYTDRNRRFNFYAQSWALTHYFMMGDKGVRWPRLLAYLEAIARGVAEKEAWEQILGPREEVKKDLWKYLNGRRFSSRSLEAGVTVDGSSFPLREISEAEVKAIRGDFLSRGGNRAVAGPLLADAIEADIPAAAKATAFEALGLLSLDATLFDKAREHFQKAIELDDSRHRTYYHLAELERRLGAVGWAERGEQHLLAATRIAPWFGLGHQQLASLYSAIDDDPARATAVARRAVKRSRGNPMGHLLLAKLIREKTPDSPGAAESVRFARHLAINASGSGSANNVCWWGTLYGMASESLPACDAAVARRPENGAYRDSRGLARAALGNLGGAVEDFEAFLASDDAEGETRTEREGWLVELRAGRNPITPEVLEELLQREL